MEIQQFTEGRMRRYEVSDKQKEPIILFEERIFKDYPYLGYDTHSSGIRLNETTGKYHCTIYHCLSAD